MTDSMLVSRSERTVSRGLLHPLEGLASGWRTSKRQEKPHWLGNLRGPPPSDLGLLRAGLYHPTRLGAPERPYFLITLGFPEGKVSAFSAGGLPKAGTTPPRGRAVGHVTCEGVTGISWARFLAWTLGPPPPAHIPAVPHPLCPQCSLSSPSPRWWTSLLLSRKMATRWASWSSLPRR